MSVFDSVINETREKFNLGDKTNVLLSALLAVITDKTRGGIAGFLEQFNRAGLSGVASLWVNSGANTSISNEQLEYALGNDTIQSIADRTATDYQTASSAIAFMLPHVVDNLTPDGIVPDEDDLLSRTGTYLTPNDETFAGVSAANTVDRIGTSATDVIDAGRANIGDRMGISGITSTVGERVNASVDGSADYETADNDSPLSWLLPLIIVALLVILGYSFCSKPEEHKAANIKTVSIRQI